MDTKKITATAKTLHATWLKENKTFVSLCQKDPLQTNNSRDFTRALPWKDLPEVWKKYYRKEAKIKLLSSF